MPTTHLARLFQDLVAAEPALAAVRAEHVADNGEVLPHLLMADITRWLVAHPPAPAVLAVLEQYIDRDDASVRDVLLASFLENLERGEGAHDRIRAALGPRLRAASIWYSLDRHRDPPI